MTKQAKNWATSIFAVLIWLSVYVLYNLGKVGKIEPLSFWEFGGMALLGLSLLFAYTKLAEVGVGFVKKFFVKDV